MTHDEMIAVIQAHKDGKAIQYWGACSEEWIDDNEPRFNFGCSKYRVKPEPKVGYVNVYAYGPLQDSRGQADNSASSARIACVRIEYTEGQYDK